MVWQLAFYVANVLVLVITLSTLAFRNLVAQVFAAFLFFINNIEDLLNKYCFYITFFFLFFLKRDKKTEGK